MGLYNLSFEFNDRTQQYFVRKDKYPLGKFILDFLDFNINSENLPKLEIEYIESDNATCKYWSIPKIEQDDYVSEFIFAGYRERNPEDKEYIRDLHIKWLQGLQNTLSDNLSNPECALDYSNIDIEHAQENSVPFSDNFHMYFEGEQNIRVNFERYAGSATDFYIYYTVDDIVSLLMFDYVKIREHNATVKKCANCGKYFIPSKRSDEIYCDRIFKSNRTCKQVGYEEKEKRDPFGRLYTRARKTQYARISYNSHIKDYREKHYEPWKKAAEEARNKFKAKEDIEGFKKWIEENKNLF